MRILYVGLRNKSHSTVGGYDKICNMPYSSNISSNSFPFSNIPLGKLDPGCCCFIKRLLRRVNISIPQVLSHLLRWKYDITHLYYAEFVIPFLPYFKNNKHKIVATIHLDIGSYRCPNRFLKFFKRLDGLIVLSSQQSIMLNEKYGLKTTFIPHGFSKPVYSFKEPVDRKGQFVDRTKVNLFVAGSNYRDIQLLKDVVFYSMGKELPICFHLVGMNSKIKDDFFNCSNVRIYNRLDDDKYFSLLSICDYNFLPLLFATANNVLLEAQFSSKRSILPRIGGVLDYAAPEPLNMFYESTDDLIILLSSLAKEKSSNPDFELFVKRFEWNTIYNQLLEYYQSL